MIWFTPKQQKKFMFNQKAFKVLAKLLLLVQSSNVIYVTSFLLTKMQLINT